MNRSQTLKQGLRTGVALMALLLASQLMLAGPIHDRIMERRAARQAEQTQTAQNPPEQTELDGSTGTMALPAGVRLLRDLSYGPDNGQRMDVYLPTDVPQTAAAPVIFMVHGGAWRLGDKGARAVVENKVARWLPRGFVFISANYRLLPGADPLAQARDVARAVAAAQAKAASWGADPAKFILMGHSAGAHLVALLTASPTLAAQQGVKPWLGTVALDSAALDVVQVMEAKHARLYDRAFGSDPAYWRSVSPFHALSAATVPTPFLAVCSERRSGVCARARQFAAHAAARGMPASVLPQDLSHGEVNQQLGLPGAYTEAVESFMDTLDEAVKRALHGTASGSRRRR